MTATAQPLGRSWWLLKARRAQFSTVAGVPANAVDAFDAVRRFTGDKFYGRPRSSLDRRHALGALDVTASLTGELRNDHLQAAHMRLQLSLASGDGGEDGRDRR